MAVNGVFAGDQLKLFIERIERLEEEKKGIADDIRDVYAEAKANGFDPKTMRKCVALRKLDTNAREEQEALLDTYKSVLGLSFDSTPLGDAVAKMDKLADESGGAVKLQDDSGTTIAEFGSEAKRRRTPKARDPSDGSLVTIPPKAANG